MMSMTASAKAAGQPRPLLQPGAVAGERAGAGAGPAPCRRARAAARPARQGDREVQDPAEVPQDPADARARRRWPAAAGSPRASVTHAIRPTKAQVPSSARTAGSSSRAPTMTMNTVTAAATRDAVEEVMPHDEQAHQGDDHGRGGELHRPARGAHRLQRRLPRLPAVDERLAVAVDDEQRVVDADAEADHRREDRREGRHVEVARDQRQREARRQRRPTGPPRRSAGTRPASSRTRTAG